MGRTIVKLMMSLITLYIGGILTIKGMEKIETAAKLRISKGLSPMREFNRSLNSK